MLLVLITTAIFFSTTVLAQDSCGGGFEQFGTTCYAYVDHEQSWPEAQGVCTALGGFLAEIYDDATDQYIQKMARDKGNHPIWLGGEDLLKEGEWYWAKSGVLIKEYSDWAPNQPDDGGDENCLELNVDDFSGHWNDDQCEHKQRFVCQKYMTTVTIG